MSNIFIVGITHHNTLSMVRCFGEAGYKVHLIIIGNRDSYVASSIYVKQCNYISNINELIPLLLKLFKIEKNKPVVISCSDDVASEMDLNYTELYHLCYFFNAKGMVTEFMDKQKQLEIAKECGFSIPFSIQSYPQNINVFNIGYPCLIKPKESIHGGKHIAICSGENELAKVLSEYNPFFEVLVQDYIKKEYEIVILGMSYEGRHYIPGFIIKHREFRGGTTYSTTYPIADLNSNLIKSCQLLIDNVGYSGLWGIECIKQGDKYYFIELNMRNDATTYAMAIAGVNLPVLFYKICVEDEYLGMNDDVLCINSMVEYEDFNFVLKFRITIFTWIWEYKNSSCLYFNSKSDPMPSKIRKKEYIRFLKKRLLNIFK